MSFLKDLDSKIIHGTAKEGITKYVVKRGKELEGV
jgi:hypothetical protein